jgi:CheY-like chemotaxis protein
MTRILLVDDNEDYCETLKEVFTRRGFGCTYLLSAETAIGFAERYRPDLAILDFHLGDGMTGADLARRFRADPLTANIPLVFVSSDPDALPRAFAAGVDAFLQKPFELSKLLGIVRSLTQTWEPIPTAELPASAR